MLHPSLPILPLHSKHVVYWSNMYALTTVPVREGLVLLVYSPNCNNAKAYSTHLMNEWVNGAESDSWTQSTTLSPPSLNKLTPQKLLTIPLTHWTAGRPGCLTHLFYASTKVLNKYLFNEWVDEQVISDIKFPTSIYRGAVATQRDLITCPKG